LAKKFNQVIDHHQQYEDKFEKITLLLEFIKTRLNCFKALYESNESTVVKKERVLSDILESTLLINNIFRILKLPNKKSDADRNRELAMPKNIEKRFSPFLSLKHDFKCNLLENYLDLFSPMEDIDMEKFTIVVDEFKD